MIRILLYILFFWCVLWSWNAVEDCMIPTGRLQTEENSCETKAYIDPMIYVLMEANRCADVISLSENSLPTNCIRRLRLGEQHAGIFSISLKNNLKSVFNHLFNSSLELSQEYAALLKEAGYYVYFLRKIII